MSVYVITAVRLDESGKVLEAIGGKVDPANNQYIGQPTLMPASDIASRIIGGDQVFSVFNVDDHRVLGPQFRNVVYQGGAEGIELIEDIQDRGLSDLVWIGEPK